MDWPDSTGTRHQDQVYGCYVEGDYGLRHPLIPSLQYLQVCDPYEDYQLADRGHVVVKAMDGYQECIFEYDFSKLINDSE